MNVVEKTAIGKDKMKVTIYNPNRGNVSKVEFPTWSNTNGQDDIKWLNGTKNSDGSYSVIVDANEYKHDGQFITHIYATTNGTRSGIGSTSYNLEFPPMNVVEKTAIGKDKMKVTIYNPNRGNVSKVEFPTWSNTNGQDDIKWLNGTKNSDGSYSVIVDANEYKHDGQFITHIYATTNGTRSGIGSTSYNLEFPPMNVVEKTAIGNNKMKVTIFNPNRGNVSKVEFPTWSNTNGQDDIKWLNGTKNSDGSWSVIVDSAQFKNGGLFITHIYGTINGKSTGLGSTSYNLERTVVTQKELNVPFINQYSSGAPMGCEAASLLQGLHTVGKAKNYNLGTFLREMPISPNKNPNNGFAGTPYAYMTDGTYQSIFAKPLADWGKRYGNVQDISGSSPAELRWELEQGNPVVVYVTYEFASPIWGNYFWGRGVDNAHIMTLAGYNDQAKRYLVSDPAKGKYWVDYSTFEKAYNLTKGAVVVRK
ncbi:hypothetical protein C240_3187 [Enterococcus sp. 5H]|nr:hypothetical protein [Enterococcus sp. 5H]